MALHKRGEIWWVDPDFAPDGPDKTIGGEIKKERPVVVISSDAFEDQSVRIVVPFTSWQSKFTTIDFHYRVDADEINCLDNDSSINILQTRCLSTLRFEGYIGRLTQEQMRDITNILGLIIEADFS